MDFLRTLSTHALSAGALFPVLLITGARQNDPAAEFERGRARLYQLG